jgi:hypothetical protein
MTKFPRLQQVKSIRVLQFLFLVALSILSFHELDDLPALR